MPTSCGGCSPGSSRPAATPGSPRPASSPSIPGRPLFTNAGMNQFIPYFLGEELPPYRRATTVQKCVRVRGKHDDIDLVGRTTRHLTFFEMLGNFSFGDYFKVETITWAWELLTGDLGLDGERLWATVYTDDDEADAIWRDAVGLPAGRIQRMGEDNFWEMGETGPCGPCSEIYYDRGPAFGEEGGPVGGGEERYVELWNLVFTQYDRQADGSLEPLPRPNIDTGAGFERVLTILEDVPSIWETGVLRPIIARAEQLAGRAYGRRRRDRRGPAGAGRPRPQHGPADRRRGAALQRRPGLRAAPADPPGRADRPPPRGGGPGHPGPGRLGRRGAGHGLPRPRLGPRPRLRGARARGGRLRPHAAHRPHPLERGPGVGRPRRRRPAAPRRGRLPAARHPRLPDRAHRGAGRRGRRGRRPRRLRRAHGGPARTGPPGGARRRRRPTRTPTAAARGRGPHRVRGAGAPRPTPCRPGWWPSWPGPSRGRPRSSWTAPPSTPRAAGRWATPVRSSPRPVGPMSTTPCRPCPG